MTTFRTSNAGDIPGVLEETHPTITERSLAVALDALDRTVVDLHRRESGYDTLQAAYRSLEGRYGDLSRRLNEARSDLAETERAFDRADATHRQAIDEAWTLMEQHVPVNAAAIVATLPSTAEYGGGCSSWDVAAVRWRNRWVGDPEAATRARAAGSARAREVAEVAEPLSGDQVRLSGYEPLRREPLPDPVRAADADPGPDSAADVPEVENGAESAGSGDDLRRAVDDQALALAMLDAKITEVARLGGETAALHGHHLHAAVDKVRERVDKVRDRVAAVEARAEAHERLHSDAGELRQAVDKITGEQLVDLGRSVTELYQAVPTAGHLRARVERVEGALANLAAGRSIDADPAVTSAAEPAHSVKYLMGPEHVSVRCSCGWVSTGYGTVEVAETAVDGHLAANHPTAETTR